MACTFATLKAGDKESVTKKITSEVIFAFADVSEDRKRVFTDRYYGGVM